MLVPRKRFPTNDVSDVATRLSCWLPQQQRESIPLGLHVRAVFSLFLSLLHLLSCCFSQAIFPSSIERKNKVFFFFKLFSVSLLLSVCQDLNLKPLPLVGFVCASVSVCARLLLFATPIGSRISPCFVLSFFVGTVTTRELKKKKKAVCIDYRRARWQSVSSFPFDGK